MLPAHGKHRVVLAAGIPAFSHGHTLASPLEQWNTLGSNTDELFGTVDKNIHILGDVVPSS